MARRRAKALATIPESGRGEGGTPETAQLWRAAKRPDYDGALLLDTHVWVWMLGGDISRMAPTVVPIIERAAVAGRLYVCDISYWEVAVKTAKRKLVLSVDPVVWLQQAERAPGVHSIPLDRAILIQSARLAGEVHGDLADRMLIAAAQLRGMPLVTCDTLIIAYAATERGIPVCDARP